MPLSIIEYPILPKAWRRNAKRPASFASGRAARRSTCSAWRSLERVTRTAAGADRIHVARKTVAHFDPETGQSLPCTAAREAERAEIRAVHLRRAADGRALARGRDAAAEEFAPLKNATGADSPETARAAQSRCMPAG